MKKAYLISVDNIVMWLYHSLTGVRDNVSAIRRTEAKYWVSVTPYKVRNKHIISRRKIIIHCILTLQNADTCDIKNTFFYIYF